MKKERFYNEQTAQQIKCHFTSSVVRHGGQKQTSSKKPSPRPKTGKTDKAAVQAALSRYIKESINNSPLLHQQISGGTHTDRAV